MNTLILPHVNLNGTGPQTLLNDYQTAYHKLQEALDAMRAIEFHSRDYAQQADGVAIWREAVKQQEARWEKVTSVAEDYLNISIHVNQFIKP